MKLNQVLNALGVVFVACTAIPGIPAWAASVLSALALAAGKLASTPLDNNKPPTA